LVLQPDVRVATSDPLAHWSRLADWFAPLAPPVTISATAASTTSNVGKPHLNCLLAVGVARLKPFFKLMPYLSVGYRIADRSRGRALPERVISG
jgi:hypothetical protein